MTWLWVAVGVMQVLTLMFVMRGVDSRLRRIRQRLSAVESKISLTENHLEGVAELLTKLERRPAFKLPELPGLPPLPNNGYRTPALVVEPTQVFCKDCKHFNKDMAEFGGAANSLCKFGPEKLDPIQSLVRLTADPKIKNKDFNCEDFTRKT